jgi:lysophospholipase L1-like esterase
MSENAKGKVALNRIYTDGSVKKEKEEEKKLKIEFIGDSISCGFGNLSTERDRLFFTDDENGWMSHAAIGARKLNADFSIISFSGIAVTEGIGKMPWPAPDMKSLYPYTDRLIEEELGEKNSFKEWNFKNNRPDVIVINLGTNDATVIDSNEDIEAGTALFEKDYYDFLKIVREKNTKEPYIICALGSMDYYLFDNIEKVVEKFSDDFDDKRISCFKYGRLRFTDGYGACGHPNVKTQMRMGCEIAEYIKSLKGDRAE